MSGGHQESPISIRPAAGTTKRLKAQVKAAADILDTTSNAFWLEAIYEKLERSPSHK